MTKDEAREILQKLSNGVLTFMEAEAIECAIQALGDGWVSVDERLPDVDGFKGSDRVFVMYDVGGKSVMGIMAYSFISEDDGFYAWCNCHNDIDGDPEFDDNYDVTQWQPLPSPPKAEHK